MYQNIPSSLNIQHDDINFKINYFTLNFINKSTILNAFRFRGSSLGTHQAKQNRLTVYVTMQK